MNFKGVFIFLLIYSQLTLSLSASNGFIRNMGQVADQNGQPMHEILFTFAHNNHTLHFYKDGWDLYSYKQLDSLNTIADKISCRFEGISSIASLEEGEFQEYAEHYYQSYLKGGPIHAHSVKEFWIRNLYPGIDYHVMLKEGKLKYEFEVAAGADVSIIKWHYSGLNLEESLTEGHIQLGNDIGQLEEDQPFCFIKESGQEITGAFTRRKGNSWGYLLEDGKKTEYARVIDPWLIWTSFYGGNGMDYQYGYREFKDGSIFISGMTYSIQNIGLHGFRDTLLGQIDHYVMRLNKNGIPIWGSYYGGSNIEADGRMYFLGETQFYLLGSTRSNDSHTRSSHTIYSADDLDILLYRIDSSGIPLWSKRFGGDSLDWGHWMAISPDSLSLYIHGRTKGVNGEINTRGTTRLSSAEYDAYLMKLDTAGNLQWSQVWGGDGNLELKATNIDMGQNGDFAVLYTSVSRNKGTTNGFQQNPLNSAGDRTQYVTYYDSSGHVKWSSVIRGNNDFSDGHVRLDHKGKMYVLGTTYSSSNLIYNPGPRQSTFGGQTDGYMAKIDTSGKLIWVRYLGGYYSDQCYILEFKNDSIIYVAGTAGADPFFSGSIQNTSNSSRDGFLIELDTAGVINWGTYYGGDNFEVPQYMSFRDHYITLSGYTYSSTYFGSHRSYQTTSSAYEGYLLRITMKRTLSSFKLANSYCAGDTLEIPILLEDSLKLNNQIIVELSEPSGSFGTPLVLLSNSKNTVGYDTLVVPLPVTTWPSSSYRLRFRVTSPQDTLTFQDSFQVKPAPNQNYTQTNKYGLCPGDTIQMESVNPVNYRYVWFKDGQAIGDTLKSMTLSTPGDYQAIITGTNGCMAQSYKRTFYWGIVPEARIFTEDSVSCYTTQNFSALDSSLTSNKTRVWTLDGTNTDTAKIFRTGQLDTGLHVLELLVESQDACRDSIYQSFLVHPVNPAVFLLSDSIACLNEQDFLFRLPVLHPFSSYQFSLGDSSIISQDSFSYTYSKIGNYSVQLTVENQFGCKDSITRNVVVQSVPVANFEVLDTLFCSNLPATQFSNQSRNYLQSRWSFGDGDSSSYPNPSHAYTPGIYDIELVVRNAKGCRDTISKPLTMYAPPFVTIAYSDSMLCLGDSTLFQSNCDSTWTYSWSGLGMKCTKWISDSSVHELVVTNAQGCKDTASAKIGIYPTVIPPLIIQSWDTLSASSGYSVYRWYYDGSLVPSANGSHLIANKNGKYKVEVEDANGCIAQSAEYVLSNVGLEEWSAFSFIIYPNPNTGTFKIKLEELGMTTQVTIEVLNGLGQKMPCTANRISTNELEVKMNTVVPGIYYLKLVCAEKMYWKKVEVLPNSQ